MQFMEVSILNFKEEIVEQINRCKELQSQCQLRDVETFINLSIRIEKLANCLKEREVAVKDDELQMM